MKDMMRRIGKILNPYLIKKSVFTASDVQIRS